MKNTKKLTFCAIMGALGVVFLFLGSLLEMFDLCTVLLSALLIFIVREELGGGSAMATYGVCAIISVLLLPVKTVAIEYVVFGFYPVLRAVIEKLPKALCIIAKAIYMVLSTALILFTLRFFFTTGEPTPLHIDIATAVMGLVCLVLVDIVFKRFSKLYHNRIRKTLRIDKFFDK